MLDYLSYIPDSLKKKIVDELVEFMANQAEKFANEQIADKLRKLSSQGEFNSSVKQAIQKGADRFSSEYVDLDEDLAEAIREDSTLWESKSFQNAITVLLKRPGAWNLSERNEIIDHFNDILPKRRQRDRVDRAVSYLLHCIVEELWSLPGAKEIREVYAIQFQKISAEAAREQVTLARQQLQATTQLTSDMRQVFLQLSTALEKNLLVSPVVVSLPHPKPLNNLPRPDYSVFVGRIKELDWLRNRLASKDRAWQIALTGIGGVGKSSLALKSAHEMCEKYNYLAPDERFEAIIWISAKEEILTAHGREQAALPGTVLHNLEDVYTAIARVLEREDITRALPEEQGFLVEKALKEQRTLLVMDNLESIKDERIKPFLRNLPAPTKAIITSREWLDVADVWSLTGLNSDEANTLILEESSLRNVHIDNTQCRRIYDLTFGIPLPIKLAVARLSGGENFPAVERWLGDATVDLPEYCIAGQVRLARQRDPNTLKILLACSLFDREAGVQRDTLRHVADLSLADLDKGLTVLQHLFLVNRTEKGRFWLLPILERYLKEQLKQSDIALVIIEKWLNWLVYYVDSFRGDLDIKGEGLNDFGLEYANVLSAIRWCRENNRWDILIKLAYVTWFYTYYRCLYREWEEIIEAVKLAVNQSNDEQDLGRLEFQLSSLAWVRGNYNETLTHLDISKKIAFAHNNEADIKRILSFNSYALIVLGRFADAEELIRALMMRGEETGDALMKYLGCVRYAEFESSKGNFDKALVWIDKAQEFPEMLIASRWSTSLMHLRGEVLMKKGDYFAAEPYILNALKGSSELGEIRYVAVNQRHLAQIYLQTDRLHLARQFAEEAYNMFSHLGVEREIQKTRMLITQIDRSIKGESDVL